MILLAVVAGLVLGSLLGDLAASLLQPGWLRNALTEGPTIGLTTPATLDLRSVSLTFGFALKVNLLGVVGVILAALLLRRR